MAFDAGTNCVTKAEDALRSLVSNNSQFQAFTSAANAAAALARIYTYEVPLPVDSDRDDWRPNEWLALYPCATIKMPLGNEWFSFQQTARDEFISFEASISFILCLEGIIDPAENEQDQIRKFMNSAVNVLQALTLPTDDEPGQFMFSGLESLELTKFAFHKRRDLGEIICLAVKVTRDSYPLDHEVPGSVPADAWGTHAGDEMVTHAGDYLEFQVA